MDSARSWFHKFQPRDKPRKKDMLSGSTYGGGTETTVPGGGNETETAGKLPPLGGDGEALSSTTKQKVAAAKQYIENHYKEQMKNLNERKERYIYMHRIFFCNIYMYSIQHVHIYKHIRVLMGYLFKYGRRTTLEKKLADAEASEEDQNNLLKFLEKKETEYMRLQRHKMGADDFELLTMIGKGAFGEVRVCREKNTGHVFAMKKLKKSEMLRRGQVIHKVLTF